jgi:site-specific recombinase XerD
LETISLEQWTDAYDLWLNSRRSESTKRAYKDAFNDLLTYVNKPINSVTRSDVNRWMAYMIGRKLAGKTICLKVNAISSFYNYIKELYLILMDGVVGILDIRLLYLKLFGVRLVGR